MTSRPLSATLVKPVLRLLGNLIAAFTPGPRKLCILTYHRILEKPDPLLESEVDLQTFRWHMRLLAQCFNVLPLHEALQRMRNHQLPPRAVCITFDDGYRSAYELAIPVLQELNLSATIFTTTAHLDGGSMWNDRIIEAVRALPDGAMDWRALDLGTELGLESHINADSRIRIVACLNDYAKYLQPSERLQVITILEKTAGIVSTPDLMLNREMIKNLKRNAIDVGGHTVTHPILSKLDDAQARQEILDNKQTLEQIIGEPLRLFAYPNGKAGIDFNERHIRMVSEAGFDAAFTTTTSAAACSNDRFQIPRSRPWDATPFLFGLRLLRWLSAKEV